ncbi:MAG: hypothetical protein PVSMB1_04980 [Gemmatimonadaceae bacterium]
MKRRKNPAAVALGRRGGKAKSDAKTTASRSNGKRGGRPTRLVQVGAAGAGEVEVHADAEHVGYTVIGECAFLARTPAAAQWLRRHGYRYKAWKMREVLNTIPTGKCWA